jgi:Zn-dependent protease with chaperone function
VIHAGGKARRCAALLAATAMTATPPLAQAAEPARAATAIENQLAVRPVRLRPSADTPEGGIWGASDKAEEHVKTAADLDRDPELKAYVGKVICKVATDYCPELRVYVLDRPFLNAGAAPNGYVEVYSGLLLRARTEDELAFVLGHEVSHFARNHTLAQWNKLKSTANGMLAIQLIVAAGAGAAMYSAAANGASYSTINSISGVAQSVSDLFYLNALGSVMGYARDLELEADKLGFERARAAGYAASGVGIYGELISEAQASDFPKIRTSEARASIFATHPLTQDRLDALAAMGAARAEPDLAAQKAYRAVIRPHLGTWLDDDLRRRDYGQSIFLIDRLSALGEDMGVLAFYRGEAFRKRRGDGDGPRALEAYRTSVAYPDAPPVAWREYGDALRKAGDRAAAGEAFKTYLSRAPGADDRWLVESTLNSLDGVK